MPKARGEIYTLGVILDDVCRGPGIEGSLSKLNSLPMKSGGTGVA